MVEDRTSYAAAVPVKHRGRRALKAHQRPRDEQVGIAGGLLPSDLAGRVSVPGEKAIAALQMIACPRPYAGERATVSGRFCQQHAVRLSLADRVIALVQP